MLEENHPEDVVVGVVWGVTKVLRLLVLSKPENVGVEDFDNSLGLAS